MQWTMSDRLCEAPRIRQIRRQRRSLPRWSAYLWSGMVKLRLCEVESVFESSITIFASKWRYGAQMECNSVGLVDWVKSIRLGDANTSGCVGYKPSDSIEGATSEKIGDQIHKDSYPELGCSGDLNLTDTVHSVNVGTSCFGCETMREGEGLPAVARKGDNMSLRGGMPNDVCYTSPARCNSRSHSFISRKTIRLLKPQPVMAGSGEAPSLTSCNWTSCG